MKNTTKILFSSAVASLIFIGCGGGSSSSSANTASTGTVTGTTADGLYVNMKVCLDTDFDGKCTSNDKYYTYSGSNGVYHIPYPLSDKNASVAPIVAQVSDDPNKITEEITVYGKLPVSNVTLYAPRTGNYIDVTPLTTLVQAALYKDANLSGPQANLQQIKTKTHELAQKLFGTEDITSVLPDENVTLHATAAFLVSQMGNNPINLVTEYNITASDDFNKTFESVLPDSDKGTYKEIINIAENNASLLQESNLSIEEFVKYMPKDTNITKDLNSSVSLNELVLSGFLNGVYNELKENDLLSTGAYNITDWNATGIADGLISLGITTVTALNSKYQSGDLNVSDVNLSAVLNTYIMLQKAETALKASGIGQSYPKENVYFDLSTGKKIDLPDNLNPFTFANNSQIVYYNANNEFLVAGSKTLAVFAGGKEYKYTDILGADSASISDISSALDAVDINTSLLADAYTVNNRHYSIDANATDIITGGALKLDDTHYFAATDVSNYKDLKGYLLITDGSGNVTSILSADAEYYDASAASSSSSASSGSSSSSASSSATYTGYVYDAGPVEGLDYRCVSTTGTTLTTGTTDANGAFQYTPNTFACTFGLESNGKFLTISLTTNTSTQNNTLPVLPPDIIYFTGGQEAMIDETLDNDGNLSNGIQITPEEKALMVENYTDQSIVQVTSPDGIYSLLSSKDSDYHGQSYDMSTALNNVERNLLNLFKGNYTGTFKLTKGDPDYCLAQGTVNLSISLLGAMDPNDPSSYFVAGNVGNDQEEYNLSGEFYPILTGVLNDDDNTQWYGLYTKDKKIVGVYSNGNCAGTWEATLQK